jgi:phosphinothricin acetyltransferase
LAVTDDPTKAGLLVIRPARARDAEAIASIYNEGIAERQATFQTEPQSAPHFAEAIDRGDEYPLLVAERCGRVVAWAALKRYSDFAPYRPVAECMLYVASTDRRQGIGKRLLDELADLSASRGFTKLIGKIFTDNRPSIALVARCGFREVGVHLRHGRLDGGWKDVLLVERLLGDAAE